MDARNPRDGRVLEELGTYDPMVPDADARAVLDGERINYWLSVGALPSDKVKVLIEKYGAEGTHLEKQKAALDRLAQQRRAPHLPAAAEQPEATEPQDEPQAEEATAEPAEQPQAEEKQE